MSNFRVPLGGKKRDPGNEVEFVAVRVVNAACISNS